MYETFDAMPTDYEKLGLFYLGRRVDADTGATTDVPLLYDAADLVTHAVILGMTGSGKTGLGITFLEEAAIDGVPVLAIDPKGDLTNLLLTFPDLAPSDFAPWVDEGEASRKQVTVDAYAADIAKRWKAGLAELPRLGTGKVYGGRGVFVPVAQAVAEQTAYLDKADAVVTGYLQRLGSRASELSDPARQGAHHQAIQAEMARAFPGHAMPDLVGYSVYGLVQQKLAP